MAQYSGHVIIYRKIVITIIVVKIGLRLIFRIFIRQTTMIMNFTIKRYLNRLLIKIGVKQKVKIIYLTVHKASPLCGVINELDVRDEN